MCQILHNESVQMRFFGYKSIYINVVSVWGVEFICFRTEYKKQEDVRICVFHVVYTYGRATCGLAEMHHSNLAINCTRLGGQFVTDTHTCTCKQTHTHTGHGLSGVNSVFNHPCSGPLWAISLNECFRWWNRARPFTIIMANLCSIRPEHCTTSTPDRDFYWQVSGLSPDT